MKHLSKAFPIYALIAMMTHGFSSQASAKPVKKTGKSHQLASIDRSKKEDIRARRGKVRKIQDKKPFGVAAYGGFVYLGGGAGLEGWYQPNNSLQFGSYLLSGKGDTVASGEGLLFEYIEIKTTEIGLKTRYFVAPNSLQSLFLSAGLSYNRFEGEYGYQLFLTDIKSTVPYKSEAVLGHISIGNQWQFGSGFTIGADWLVGSFFLNNDVSYSSGDLIASESGSDQESKDSLKDDIDEALRKQIQVKSLLSLGWAF